MGHVKCEKGYKTTLPNNFVDIRNLSQNNGYSKAQNKIENVVVSFNVTTVREREEKPYIYIYM